MNTEQTDNSSPESRQSQTELDKRYGRIALSAVAAALPYGTGTKAVSEKPAETKTDAHN